MKILMFTSNDPAGMGIAFTNAINRTTPHRCRLITFGRVYNVDFQTDIHLPELDEDYGEVEALMRGADVFHFHNLLDENWPIGPLVIRDFARGKHVVYHEHGHPYFLANAEKMREEARTAGRRVLVSTPDLLKRWPGSTWLPNVVPLNDVRFLPAPGNHDAPEAPVRVCHAPTRKWHKNTDDFLAVMDELMKQHPAVERVVIEDVPYDACLRIKRRCHITFDHMQGHFGISSLESFSQGVPVIAGLDEWNIERILEVSGAPETPWIIARSRDQLRQQLIELIEDRSARESAGAHARAWMERYWTEQRWADYLIRFYERA